MAQARGVVYRLKNIEFLGRSVPVVLQNENGPCPLLAIANVLLLRNQIHLPQHAPDISQDSLIALVAGHLLDANGDERLAHTSEEYRANMRQNIADAIMLLPKLTTGTDVNVTFQSVRGFEFTDEIAIFDLLDISLVHGWLVDKEDHAVARAIGSKSYNELVNALVAALGNAVPAHIQQASSTLGTPQAGSLSRRLSQRSSAQADAHRAEGYSASSSSRQTQVPATCAAAELELDGEDVQHLQAALALSLGDPRAEQAEQPAAAGPQSFAPISETCPPSSEAVLQATLCESRRVAESEAWRAVHELVREAFEGAVARAVSLEEAKGKRPASEAARPFGSAAAAGGLGEASSSSAHAASAAPAKGGAGQPPPDSNGACATPAPSPAEVAAIQEFLDRTSSQLTAHGLACLHQALRPRQLAVFFRNNHFSTVFVYEGVIHILVTDQGYLHEKDVVWERLLAVDGNTGFTQADFTPYNPKAAGMRDAVSNATSLALAAFSSAVPANFSHGHGGAAPSADADYALALQLQEQEDTRQRQARAQRDQRAVVLPQDGPGPRGGATQVPKDRQDQAQGRTSSDSRPSLWRRHGSRPRPHTGGGSRTHPPVSEQSSKPKDCAIM